MKKYLLISIFAAGSSVLLYSTMGKNTDEASGTTKVKICHCPPGSNYTNCHTIEVSPNAVNAHMAHGDKIGDCSHNDITDDMDAYPHP